MDDARCNHILAMIDYLAVRKEGSLGDLIEDELETALARADKCDDITARILHLGNPHFITLWIDRHGRIEFSTSSRCPLEYLYPEYGAQACLEALALIAPSVTSEPRESTKIILGLAAEIDDPDFLQGAARILGIPHANLIMALGDLTVWGCNNPEMSAWIASLITNEFDEKDAAWRHVVNAALHSPVPNMLAAFLKLGLPLGHA